MISLVCVTVVGNFGFSAPGHAQLPPGQLTECSTNGVPATLNTTFNVTAYCNVSYDTNPGGPDPRLFFHAYVPDESIWTQRPHPTVILVHGGGCNGSSSVNNGGQLQALMYALSGFVVFAAEYDIPVNYSCLTGVHDILLLERWIATVGRSGSYAALHASGSNMALAGGSAGGTIVVHAANYTTLPTSPDPLACAAAGAGEAQYCLYADSQLAGVPMSGVVKAVIDAFGEGPSSATNPGNFGSGANIPMRPDYPQLLGVYPDESLNSSNSNCSNFGGWAPVRNTISIYNAATGMDPNNYVYVGNHDYCPLDGTWPATPVLPSCVASDGLVHKPIRSATNAIQVDTTHGENIDNNQAHSGVVYNSGLTPWQYTSEATLFSCVHARWLAQIPGLSP